MAGSYNRVILIGNLGRDAELRYTPSGAPAATFSMATTETWKDKAGAKQERTEWTRIVLWGTAAEAVSKYLTKGKSVAVEGKLQTRQWDDKNGVKRYSTEVKADRVVLLGSKEGGDGQQKRHDAESDHEPGDDAPDDGMGRGHVDDDSIPF